LVGVQLAIAVTGVREERCYLRQIEWNQTRSHDDADSLGIDPAQFEAAIAHGQARRRHAETGRPAPDLEALAMAARNERRQIDLRHFARNRDGIFRGIEGADGTDATVTVGAG